jgi:hypothetical protein
MLAARHRFPSRGTAAVRTHARKQEGPMSTPLPAEATGEFEGSGPPVQDLIGTGIRELFVGMLDAATAVRLGKTSSTKQTNTYEGTTVPTPQVWRSPTDLNSGDSVDAAVASAGNAPRAANKTTSQGADPEAPRIARELPVRPR